MELVVRHMDIWDNFLFWLCTVELGAREETEETLLGSDNRNQETCEEIRLEKTVAKIPSRGIVLPLTGGHASCPLKCKGQRFAFYQMWTIP